MSLLQRNDAGAGGVGEPEVIKQKRVGKAGGFPGEAAVYVGWARRVL